MRRRDRVKGVLASSATLLAIVTLVSREWIEFVLGVDPDNGSGAIEWALVFALATVAVLGASSARRVLAQPHTRNLGRASTTHSSSFDFSRRPGPAAGAADSQFTDRPRVAAG